MNDMPFYIGLGMHKCATTWIYNCLFEHPDICIPNKDIHFFYHDHLYNQGYEWYENNILKHHKNENVIGDFSVIYLVGEHAAERIFSRYPKANLFLCLRNPVDRAWSHYVQNLKKGHIVKDVSFEQALEKDSRYILFGRYKQHIEKFLTYFPKEQIRIFLFDDIQEDSTIFIKSMYDFMGVDRDFEPKAMNTRLNSARTFRYPFVDRINTKVSELLKRTRMGQSLWWKIKWLGLPNAVRSLNTSSTKIEKPNLVVFEHLRTQFEEDIIFVKEFLNRHDLEW